MFGPPLFKNFNDCLLRIITFIDGARDIGAPIYWRRGASVRQYIGAPMSPAQKIFFRVRSATPTGAGYIGAPIVLAEYKEDDCVRCASPIFIPIAY